MQEFCVDFQVNLLKYIFVSSSLQVFFKLIRRYKYLEKPFQDELTKLILFLRGFQEEEREKLAITYGIILASGLGNAACLSSLFEDHLVKDGEYGKFWLIVVLEKSPSLGQSNLSTN